MKRYVSVERLEAPAGRTVYVVPAPAGFLAQDQDSPLSLSQAGVGPGEVVEIDGRPVVVVQVGRGRAPDTLILFTRPMFEASPPGA